MFWVLFSAVFVTGLAAGTARLARGDERARDFTLFAAFVCVVGVSLATWGALKLAELTCDESCYGPGWAHSTDAWQWKALPVLAIAGSAGILGAAVLLVIRRYRASLILLAAGTIPLIPFCALLLEAG